MSILDFIGNYLSNYNLPLPIYYLCVVLLLPLRILSDIFNILFVHPNLISPPNTVYVNGLLGFGNSVPGLIKYWGVLNSNIITPEISPLGSSYDQAVELFYNLKGISSTSNLNSKTYAPVNFHSSLHQSIMVNNKGLIPQWNENSPLTFVCHSKGCSVVARLLLLLNNNAFPGHQTSSKWIKSIVFISPGLPGVDYIKTAGLDAINLTVIKYSKLYYFLLFQYIISKITPNFIRSWFDLNNPVYKRFEDFLHDNSYVYPEYNQINEDITNFTSLIQNTGIPLLNIVTNSNQPVYYKNKQYYLVKPVCNFFLYYFQYLGDGWDGNKQDGVISLERQNYLLNKNIQNITDINVNLDHLDITGVFRKDKTVIKVWNDIFTWIKSH
jgi:hypothetical protein